MQEDLLKSLTVSQNPDGGWGYFTGKRSALEPTAFSLLALGCTPNNHSAIDKGIGFLKLFQGGTGGWPVNLVSREPAAWVTALAGTAIQECEGENQQTQQAAQFLVGSFSRMKVDWLTRLRERIGWGNSLNVDRRLGGWGWNPETAKWVEPTCLSLFCLNLVKGAVRRPALTACLAEGERMVYDRMCRAGGWNYGNSHVLGEDLRPYPLTTALALIALQKYPSRPENQQSLHYLGAAAKQEPSALALCFAILCLDLYQQEWRSLLTRLETLYHETGFLGDLRTKALALLVISASQGRNVFQYASA